MRTAYSKKIPPTWQRVSKVFMALGHEQRQRILLLFEPGEALTATQIVEASSLSRTALVHHLKALTDAKILNKRREGKEVYYSVDPELIESSLKDVLDFIRDNY